jgi:hypothetical protein
MKRFIARAGLLAIYPLRVVAHTTRYDWRNRDPHRGVRDALGARETSRT